MAEIAKLPISVFPPLRWWLCMMAGMGYMVRDERFIKQSIRNRYALANEGIVIWQTIPLKAFNRFVQTDSIGISYDQNWIAKHLQAMQTCYGKTPFFEHYIEDVKPLFESQLSTLIELSDAAIALQQRWTNTSFPTHTIQSECDFLSIQEIKFGINNPLPPYYQVFMDKGKPFIDHLSLLDLIFNLGPDAHLYLERTTGILMQTSRFGPNY